MPSLVWNGKLISKVWNLYLHAKFLTPWSRQFYITNLISNKREWNNCFIKLLRLQKLKYKIRAKKARKSERNRKMNFMKMRCCVTLCGQTDVGSSEKKHFLPFCVLQNVGIDPEFPHFFFFFGFIQRKIALSGENIFSLATLSGIICQIRSN